MFIQPGLDDRFERSPQSRIGSFAPPVSVDPDRLGNRWDAVLVQDEKHVVAGQAQVGVGRGGHRKRGRTGGEFQEVDALARVERVGYGREPQPVHLADLVGVRRGHCKGLPVRHVVRALEIRGSRPEEIRRLEDLSVPMAVLRLVLVAVVPVG